MSEYVDKNTLFLEPRTKQYGSHMVITNVQKPPKTKYINVDTRFRDEYSTTQQSNYNITLPERMQAVYSISARSIELPITFYNISDNLRNNRLKIISGSNSEEIVLSDGQYTASSLQTALNSKFSGSTYGNSLTITLASAGRTTIVSSSGSVTLNFTVDSSVCGEVSDKYNFKMSLGWLLGFRTTTSVITTSTTTTPALLDLSGPRYLYLAIDEFGKGNQHSFQCPIPSAQVNKNVLARITLDPANNPYGSILPANNYNGLLLSDMRCYTGKIDIQKLNVQLLNEVGTPMILNGGDFSFCLELSTE